MIGYEESEQLEVEPAKYYVLVTKREKRACTDCKGSKIVTAPAPTRIIEKSLASDQVVIDTVIRKYCDYLPLYRQSVILDREAGVEISRATLDGWVLQVGEMLRPLVAVMGRELVQGSYLQADETPVGVQMPMVGVKIIRRFCGSTDDREERRYSTSAWGEIVLDPNSFWKTFMAFCRPMPTRPITRWGGREWCMRRAGRMRGAVLPMWSS